MSHWATVLGTAAAIRAAWERHGSLLSPSYTGVFNSASTLVSLKYVMDLHCLVMRDCFWYLSNLLFFRLRTRRGENCFICQVMFIPVSSQQPGKWLLGRSEVELLRQMWPAFHHIVTLTGMQLIYPSLWYRLFGYCVQYSLNYLDVPLPLWTDSLGNSVGPVGRIAYSSPVEVIAVFWIFSSGIWLLFQPVDFNLKNLDQAWDGQEVVWLLVECLPLASWLSLNSACTSCAILSLIAHYFVPSDSMFC